MKKYPFILIIGYILFVLLISEYSPVAGGALLVLLVLLMLRKDF